MALAPLSLEEAAIGEEEEQRPATKVVQTGDVVVVAHADADGVLAAYLSVKGLVKEMRRIYTTLSPSGYYDVAVVEGAEKRVVVVFCPAPAYGLRYALPILEQIRRDGTLQGIAELYVVDMGMRDAETIKVLKRRYGCRVTVIDHHSVPEEIVDAVKSAADTVVYDTEKTATHLVADYFKLYDRDSLNAVLCSIYGDVYAEKDDPRKLLANGADSFFCRLEVFERRVRDNVILDSRPLASLYITAPLNAAARMRNGGVALLYLLRLGVKGFAVRNRFAWRHDAPLTLPTAIYKSLYYYHRTMLGGLEAREWVIAPTEKRGSGVRFIYVVSPLAAHGALYVHMKYPIDVLCNVVKYFGEDTVLTSFSVRVDEKLVAAGVSAEQLCSLMAHFLRKWGYVADGGGHEPAGGVTADGRISAADAMEALVVALRHTLYPLPKEKREAVEKLLDVEAVEAEYEAIKVRRGDAGVLPPTSELLAPTSEEKEKREGVKA